MNVGKILEWLGLGRRADFGFFLRRWSIPGDARMTASVLATMCPIRAVAPVLAERPPGKRITVVAPHPDDELMGPGGTLLRALSQGVSVCVIYLTDGEHDPTSGAQRRAEATSIADALGYEPVFLSLGMANDMTAGNAHLELARAIEISRPDVLFYPFVLDDNIEHRVANRLLATAVSAKSGLAWRGDVWCYQVYSVVPGNVLVPLGEFAVKKADAIRLYKSQLAVRDWATFALGLNAVNARFTSRTCKDTHVESFLVLPLTQYLDAVHQWFLPQARDAS